MNNNIFRSKLEKFSEFILLLIFSVYLLFLLFQSSTYHLPFPPKFEKHILFLLCLTLVFRIPVIIKAPKTALIATVLLALNYALIYRSLHYPFLLFSGLLTLGFFGIDYQKVMKLFTIILGYFLIMTFSAACCSAIQDFVYMKDGYIRSALGTGYPTDMASYVLFLLMYIWAGWKKLPDLVAAFLGILCFFFSRYIAMSTTSSMISLLFSATALGHFLCIECELGKCFPTAFRKFFKTLMVFSFPLFGILIFALIFSFSRGLSPALKINSILSDRLELALEAYRQFGLKAFGSPLPQNGNGFSNFAPSEYNFVDSTYPLILLRYGWILFLSLCTTWSFCTKKALLHNDNRLACLFVLIAFHSFSEHHFIEINFNPLVVMPFAAFLPVSFDAEKAIGHKLQEFSRSVKIILIILGSVLLSVLLLPRFFTWMRTLIQIHGWTAGNDSGLLVLSTLTGIYALSIFFTVGIISLFRSVILSFQSPKNYSICIVISTLISLASFFLLFHVRNSGNQQISRSMPKYNKQLLADQKALQLITESASGTVYVDHVPSMYQQTVSGISDTVFCGDELARFSNTSVITDWTNDSDCFINSGFLFTRISNAHALYTNDSAVIGALKERGVHLTGYYNVVKSINLSYLARLNGLNHTKKSGLSLNGNDYALEYGPFLSLYTGEYTVEYKFYINEGTEKTAASVTTAGNEIALLKITAYNGKTILKEHMLTLDQFNENGEATIKIPFITGSCSDVEFHVIPQDNSMFNISSICYYRSPQYDVHMLYNQKHQKYREEYYTLDGDPAESSKGYSACEYEYDFEGRITEIRYYDKNNSPAILGSGYSSLKRKLDSRGRNILESYYGPDGEPVLCSAGYASTSMEYDSDTTDIAVQKYYGLNGELTRTISLYAEIHKRFNEKHQCILESYYDTTGSPFIMPGGYAMLESEYDSNNRPYIQRFLDSKGVPVMVTAGYAEIHREYTPQNWVFKETYYGIDGNPIALPAGYEMIRRTFDDRGNAILTEYCTKDGSRVMTDMHYSALVHRFNERNHIIYDCYLDVDDLPIVMPGNFSAIEYDRNSIGDATTIKYFDQYGNLTTRSEGFAEVLREYDENRNPIREIYLDTNEKPVFTSMEYAEIHREYDNLRRLIREWYYDTEGLPMTLASGYASTAFERDQSGQALVYRYFGLDGNPVTLKGGYAELHRSYNENGLIASESYYDINQNPCISSSGFHKVEYERDGNNQIIRFRYFDTSDQPILVDWGYSEERRTYHPDGSIASQQYFDLLGNNISVP